MFEADDTQDDRARAGKYAVACRLAESLAQQLAGRRVESIDVAAALLGAGLNVLVPELGKAGAVAYLRELTAKLERDEDRTTALN